jgi:hypothetical protein
MSLVSSILTRVILALNSRIAKTLDQPVREGETRDRRHAKFALNMSYDEPFANAYCNH